MPAPRGRQPRVRVRSAGRPPRRLRRGGPLRRPERARAERPGPVGLDVAYDLAEVPAGAEVRASVSVRPARGLLGRLLAEATSALLSAGALQHAVSRIAREAALA